MAKFCVLPCQKVHWLAKSTSLLLVAVVTNISYVNRSFAQVRELCTDYSDVSGEFFFDRHPRFLHCVQFFLCFSSSEFILMTKFVCKSSQQELQLHPQLL